MPSGDGDRPTVLACSSAATLTAKEIRMSTHRLLANAAVVGACLLPLACEAAYDPAAQFSPTQNPSGSWSYGWSVSLGTQFILDTRHVREPLGIDG
jgi:hypothetical protein